MIPVLETPRLVLRGICQEDFEDFAAFYGSEAARFVGGPLAREQAWRSLAASAGGWALRGYGEFSVEEKATGAFVGLVGPWFPEGWPEPEIAWIILPAFQRRGYGVEAAGRALRFAYEACGWTTAISCIASGNAPSIRLAERLGARNEGSGEVRPHGLLDIYRHLPPGEFESHLARLQ